MENARQIVVSAPGKVIVHGEHAVVYGKEAVVASINLRTRIRLEKTGLGMLELYFPCVNVASQWNVGDLQELLIILCKGNGDFEFPSEQQMARMFGIEKMYTRS